MFGSFGPQPTSGVTHTIFCVGSLMSQGLQCTQSCALITRRSLPSSFRTIQRFASLTNGFRMAAAMSGWLTAPSLSPMSWSSADTPYSSSRPSRSARVAVCRL